jgi:hypothetical protein
MRPRSSTPTTQGEVERITVPPEPSLDRGDLAAQVVEVPDGEHGEHDGERHLAQGESVSLANVASSAERMNSSEEVGSAIAKAIFKFWTKDNKILTDAGTSR